MIYDIPDDVRLYFIKSDLWVQLYFLYVNKYYCITFTSVLQGFDLK